MLAPPLQIPVLIPEAHTVLAIASLAVGLVALLLAVVATRRAGRLAGHYHSLMRDVEGTDLAAALETYVARQAAAGDRIEALEAHTAGIGDMVRRIGAAESAIAALESRAGDTEARVRRATRHVGVLRYGAFADVGGDQSFVIVMLDDHGDGVVLSGLHHRNGVRVYAKPLAGKRSTYALTTEEERLIAETGPTPPPG